MIDAKDLTKEPPRSPNELLGGYKVLARAIDKCRSSIAGTEGEYTFNSPVDQRFFEWKEIDAEDFKKFVAQNHTDTEILDWVNLHGIPKSPEEIEEWSEHADMTDYGTRADKKEWFSKACEKAGLDPLKTSLFTLLDTEDKLNFSHR